MRSVPTPACDKCVRLQMSAKMESSESKRRNAESQSGNHHKTGEDSGADKKETIDGKCLCCACLNFYMHAVPTK